MKIESSLPAQDGTKLWWIHVAILWFFALPAQGQQPAFPGALGFGANATGGRSGTVYHVTNLNDSGSGSFRDAVSSSGRIVVFDVGGYITLSSEVSVKNRVTIAGQTAPGGGIGIKGNEVSCGASSNIIIRHVRFRPGDGAPNGAHGLSVYFSTNVIADHVSIEFGNWNNIGAVNCQSLTVQSSINANPTYQQFGAHVEKLGASFAWLYNLWASGHNRQPLDSINDIFINNVLYNFDAGYTTHTSGNFSHDIIGNYFICGPASGNGANAFFQIDINQSIYSTNNLSDCTLDGALDDGTVINPYPGYQGTGTILNAPWSTLTPNIPTFTTAAAVPYVLSTVGAFPRDEVDALVVGQVLTLGNGPTGTVAGTAGPDGGLYTSETQTGLGNGGFGVISGGTPLTDTDQDGIPDLWETANGFNPFGADEKPITSTGYTRIEDYLNWLALPHAIVAANSSADLDLQPYTIGYTNDSPVYTLSNATNGTATLLGDGHTARFTPTSNSFGTAGFKFTVTSASGAAMTNSFGLLVISNVTQQVLIWRGDGLLNNWDVDASTNWFDGTNLVVFGGSDRVSFDDTGSNTPAINLVGSLSPNSCAVNATQNYTFAGGALGGSMSLVKSGTGTLTLNITSTYSGGTTVSNGMLAGNTTSLQGSILNNGALLFNQSSSANFTGSISGTGSLTKTGGGQLTLPSGSSYSGKTYVNGGTVSINADSALGANPATTNLDQLVLNGGTLRVTANVTHGSLRGITLGASNGTIEVTGANTMTNTLVVSGPGSLTKNGTGMLALGWTSGTADHTYNGLVLNSGTIAIDKSSGLGIGTVLINGGAIRCYRAAGRSPGNTVILNGDVTIGGGGFTNLISFGGPWTISNATRQITVDISTNRINGAIGQDAPGRGLRKAGLGTLALGGSNTYSGATTINAGTLLLTNVGSVAASTNIFIASGATFDVSAVTPYTIIAGQTLSGSGNVKGNVVIANGATLSPGASPGTLTFNNGLTLSTAAALNFEIGTTSDKIVVNGNLTLGGTLNVTALAGFTNTTYTFCNYTGALTYNGVNIGTTPAGYGYMVSTNTPGQINLIVTPLSAFEQWQIDYFGSNNPSADANFDADGDGQNNMAEFLSGSNPTNSTSALRIIAIATEGTNTVISWSAVAGKTNVVQAGVGDYENNSPSYSSFFWDLSAPIIIQGSGEVVTNFVDDNGPWWADYTNWPTHYYRVRLMP